MKQSLHKSDILFFLWALLFVGYAYGQSFSTLKQNRVENSNNSSLQSIINKLDTAVARHIEAVSLLGNTDYITLTTLFQAPLPSFTAQKTTENELDLAVIETKQDILRRDLGLEFQAGYIENFKEGIFSTGDIYYKRRGRVELEWDLLKGGFFENRHKIKALEHKKEFIYKEALEKKKHQKFSTRYNLFIYYFNKERIQVIERYLQLLKTRFAATSRLYALNYINWNPVLEITTRRARLENKLKAYKAYNRQFSSNKNIASVFTTALPLVDIRIKNLLAAINPEFSKASKEREDLPKSYVKYNPLYDISLSLFARYSLFDEGNVKNVTPVPAVYFGGREYLSAGINLSIPLTFDIEKQRKLKRLEYERKHLTSTQKRSTGWKEELYNYYFEYEFALQQYIEFYGKYLKNKEKIRQQKALKTIQDEAYSPREQAELLSRRYQIRIALIDLKQKLYLKLLKISRYTDAPIRSYVQPFPLQLTAEKQADIQADRFSADTIGTTKPRFTKGVYVWYHVFEDRQNTKLVHLLTKQGVDQVYVNVKQFALGKGVDFMAQAQHAGIAVHFLVGNNQIIYLKSHQEKIKNYVERAAHLGMKGINLDVEPHTFADWDQKEKFYKKQYLALIKLVSAYAQQHHLNLSVSIPYYYDDILTEIAPYVSQVVVMIYGTTEYQKISERIAREIEVFGDKTVLAVRPTDYESLEDMNKLFHKFKKNTVISHFVLHDLNEFEVMLNRNNIENEK